MNWFCHCVYEHGFGVVVLRMSALSHILITQFFEHDSIL